MKTMTLRQELTEFLYDISLDNLEILKPLLAKLAKEDNEDWTPGVETDLTEEEHRLIAKTMERYKTHPEEFMTLEDYMKKRGL